MYTYVKAYAISRTIGSQWKELDLSKSLLSNIYAVFSKVYIIVHDSLVAEDKIVDLDFFKAGYSGMNLNLEEVLDRHSGRPLVTVDELPNMNMKYCTYSIRNKAGYRYSVTKAGYHAEEGIINTSLPDLKLTRDGYDTDMKLIDDYCLVTVNGYIHRTDSTNRESYILNGANSIRVANDDRIGILSFLDVGELEKYSILKEDVHPFRRDGALSEKMLFKVDGDLGDDSYLLVLGGYLVFPQEGIFYRHGDNSFILDINRLPYLERIFESRLFIDISEMGLEMHVSDDKVIEVGNAYSDDVLSNYLSMSNSFLVRVKTKELIVAKYSVKRMNTPGHFIVSDIPRYPLFAGYGRMLEYWYQKQGERHLVSVPDSYFRNYSFRYRYRNREQVVCDGLMAQYPIYGEGGVMLEIGSYK